MLKETIKSELLEVKNVKFTSREVDVISTILNNRGEKKIASLLCISPRTVSSHVHNVMLKTGQNSKDGIIDFIQKSGLTNDFNNHYQYILIQDIFRKYISIIRKEIIKAKIDYPASPQEKKSIEKYISDLQIAGINIVVEPKNSNSNFIKIVSGTDYYENIFSLIEKISKKSLTSLYKEFLREKDAISNNIVEQAQTDKTNKLPYIILAALSIIFVIGILIYNKTPDKPIVRADLMLPHKDIMVTRKDLLSKLTKILSNKKQISVAIISGMEGTGKSVLARTYAKSQNCQIIWEIDASSYNSMLASFEKLAYFLSETREDREHLESLEKTISIEARVKKIEYFLSKKSQKYPNWLIIYNNAPSLEAIEPYMPYDNEVWGNGSLIVTTRNLDIKANHIIPEKNIIRIGELARDEKRKLFSNILKPRLASKEESCNMLIDKIPSYPLDIFHAASYIKRNEMTCEAYLSGIDQEENLHNGDATIRNQIIARSVDKILNSNPSFIEPLILISSVGSSKIPKDLVRFISSEKDSNALLEELQKFGLLGVKKMDDDYFSIHPYVQKIALIKLKDMDFFKDSSIKTAELVNNYFGMRINENNMEKIKTNIPHIKSFILNSNIDNTKTAGDLYMKLANSYFDTGSYSLAQENYNKAYKIFKVFYTDAHPKIAELNERMGILYRNMGDYTKAKSRLEKSLKTYSRIYNKDNIKIAKAYLYLGSIYRTLEQYDTALSYTVKASNIFASLDEKPIFDIVKSDAYLGAIYVNLGQYDKATKLLENALGTYKQFYHDNHTKTAWLKVRLAIAYAETNKLNEARKLIIEARNIYQDYCGENSLEYAWSTTHLGIVNKKLGKLQEGNKLINTSIKIFRKHYKQDHKTINWASKHLIKI